MKSKRAEEFINNSSELIDGLEWMVDASTARRAVELAEQDAEEQYQDDLHHYQLMMNDTCSEMIDERDEEITRYRKELEESKRREELARNVIDDQRKKIEALKARAAEAYCKQCGWYEADGNCSLNEDKCPKGCEYANQFIREVNDL